MYRLSKTMEEIKKSFRETDLATGRKPTRPAGQDTDFLCVKEAAVKFGVSEWTVREWIKRGYISSWQPAGRKGRILIPLEAIENYTEQRT